MHVGQIEVMVSKKGSSTIINFMTHPTWDKCSYHRAWPYGHIEVHYWDPMGGGGLNCFSVKVTKNKDAGLYQLCLH